MENGELVIARILHGSMIDKQGMLHIGDVIRELNGQEVGGDPTALQEMLKDINGSVTLKILPSYRDTPTPAQVREVKRANWYPVVLWSYKLHEHVRL